MRIGPADLRPHRRSRDSVPYIACHASICGRNADQRAGEERPRCRRARRAARARSSRRRAPPAGAARRRPEAARRAAFCQRIRADQPAEQRRGAPTTASVRRSRVAAHSQVKPATDAIDGACVMLGSFTRYQSMKEPATSSTTAGAASVPGKKSRVSRYANQQPSRP